MGPRMKALSPFVDLNQIVKKTPIQVQRYLGRLSELKPDIYRSLGGKASRVKIGKYRKGLFEITFIENGARYIDVCFEGIDPDYDRYSYTSDTRTLLGNLGLDGNASAYFSNQFVTILRGLSGIYEISMFPGPKNRISYAQVMTDRKYEQENNR